MTKHPLIIATALTLLFSVEAQARSEKFLENPKKFNAMCKDGSKSQSAVSQRKASCGCAKKGGTTGQSTKGCSVS